MADTLFWVPKKLQSKPKKKPPKSNNSGGNQQPNEKSKGKKDHESSKPEEPTNKFNLKLSCETAGQQCVHILRKKVAYLKKRKMKIEENKEKVENGGQLDPIAEKSLEEYESIKFAIQFADELEEHFEIVNQLHQENSIKLENKNCEEVLRLQHTLEQLGEDAVRKDVLTGKDGVEPLSQDHLDQIDALYQAVAPTRESEEKDEEFAKKLAKAAEHLACYVRGSKTELGSTTYKELKKTINFMNRSGFLERQIVEVEETPAKSRDQETKTDDLLETSSVECKTSSTMPEAVINQSSEEPAKPVQSSEQVRTQPQPLNTLEQDSFFAPSSNPYQPSGMMDGPPFSSQSSTCSSDISSSKSSAPDIQSFTHRPFQFIQTSYVMPDSSSPSAVDPAVIAVQPASSTGSLGLQFMAPMYEPRVITTTAASHQLQQRPPQPQHMPTSSQPPAVQPHQPQVSAATNGLLASQQQSAVANKPPAVNPLESLGMTVDMSQAPVDLTQHPVVKPAQQPSSAVSTSQEFVSSSYHQAERLFPNQSVGPEDKTNSSLKSLSESRTSSRREDSISSINFDIPPSIPMPPSQDPSQVEPQEKKSPMNANAPVFQSMYAQAMPKQGSMASSSGPTGGPDMPASSAQPEFGGSFSSAASGDFMGGGDFQSGYQVNGFTNGNNYQGRGPSGNRGGYRGSRGGNSGSGQSSNNNMNSRNGGSPVQNGFGSRGSPTNTSNSRGARGGNSYQNYGAPNAGYRSDNFQPGVYGSNSFGSTYSKRGGGGMNNGMGPGNNSGYPPRAVPMGGNASRGGGMRGGMPRGGGSRGAPRGFGRPQ